MSSPRKYDTNGARQAAYRLRQSEARAAERAEKGLPSLPPIPSLPGYRRWRTALHYALALLTLVQEEMLAYYQARSETWQESDRGVAHQEQIDILEELLSTLDTLSS